MTTPDATSFQVRAELEDLLERDLLGPWDGPEEELPPGTSPAERYMLGRLVPRQAPEEPSEEDLEPELVDREVASPASGGDEEEEGAEADATVRSGSMAASAIGLAFSVPSTVDVISVTASWGRYERAPSETHETPTGRAATTWHRVPAGGSVEVRTDAEGSDSLVPDDERPGVVVRYTVRHRGARRVVELSLVNGQRAPAHNQDEARLYQAGLTVTALDGDAAIFLGHNDPDVASPPPDNDPERLNLELLHRATRMYANGRQCAVDE
ncbi:MAG: DISARM system helicase DrmA, partial [Trebonia sp.]